jgi:hypothetical protein
MAIPGHCMQRFDPTPIPICACAPRLSVPLRWGRYYVAASKPPFLSPPFLRASESPLAQTMIC